MAAGVILFWLLLLQGREQSTLEGKPGSGASLPYTERIQKQFDFYPGGKIQVDAGVPGNLKVIGWKRATVLLEAEKIFYHIPAEEAKKLSDRFPVRVRWGPTSATIQTGTLPNPLAMVEVNATLYVPWDKTDLNIRMIKGDLALEAFNGWVDATLEDGSLQAKSMQGYFSLITKRGDLNVEMSGKRWDGLGFTAATQRGRAEIRLPLDYSAALQLETRDGDITIQYPEQLVEGERVPLTVVRNKKTRSLTATVGQGGSPIRLYTAAGDMHLSTTPAP